MLRGPFLSFRKRLFQTLRLQGNSWPFGRANLLQVGSVKESCLKRMEAIQFVCFVSRKWSQLPGLFDGERQSDDLFEICIQLSLRNELGHEICFYRISKFRMSLFPFAFCAEGLEGFELCDDPGVGAEGRTDRQGRRKFFKVFLEFEANSNFNSTCRAR